MTPAKRISLPPTTRAPQLQQHGSEEQEKEIEVQYITMTNAIAYSSSSSSPLWPYQPQTPLETRGFHPSKHIV
jgi:hypothetical protein